MQTDAFFQHLWQDYIQMAPRAAQLKAVFEQRGERVLNDHVAFRSFDCAPIRIVDLEPHFFALGYRRFAPYRFDDKKLNAWGYVHDDPTQPRIFLSELDSAAMSPALQACVRELCAQVDPARVQDPSIFWAGRLWNPISYATYQTLLAESEYAAWVSAMGLRPNHFTIAINHLQHHRSVEEVLRVVEEQGIPINTAGGRVKGTPAVLLEQGATMADRQMVEFAGGKRHEVPTCYYEFALRYPDASGTLYDGFVPASADKIFESTHARR